MGAQSKRSGTARDLKVSECKRQELQIQVDADKNIEDRRKLGQFSTPIDLAKEIASYGLKILGENEISFLEPALGSGAFYSALLSELKKSSKTLIKALGVEIDSDFYTVASSVWGDSIEIAHKDFTTHECHQKINLLLTNPPYVRHQLIPQQQKDLLSKLVKSETDLELSGLAGLYCYFILLSHKWLAPGAISAWLIPSEFMDVNYGDTLKNYLLDKVHLLRVHRYTPQDSKFSDALVSSCVVWFKNEIVPTDYDVEFSYGGTHEKPQLSKMVPKTILAQERKWTHYPEADFFHRDVNDDATLGDYFTIKRGIATGDNGFFILTSEQIKQRGLDMDYFVPVLPSPRYLKENEIFRDQDGSPMLETQRFLLNCSLSENEVEKKYPNLWQYLLSGQETTGKKYLCRERKIWYLQEQRMPTPFLCSYMGRGDGATIPFRFILNHSDAIVTNSYLMLYPKKPLSYALSQDNALTEKVWFALKSITATDLENEGRVYGGGLKKIEPKELSRVRCTKLKEILEGVLPCQLSLF